MHHIVWHPWRARAEILDGLELGRRKGAHVAALAEGLLAFLEHGDHLLAPCMQDRIRGGCGGGGGGMQVVAGKFSAQPAPL